jgi:hypothetical protein
MDGYSDKTRLAHNVKRRSRLELHRADPISVAGTCVNGERII